LYELAVVISNDSDLREPVCIVRQDLNLPVGIINPHQIHSRELQEFATFIKRVREVDLANSQFSDVLEDSKGIFRKPRGW
ncbi:MAG: NYN domain-containing protein, partial [Candidatus Binatia bacterium]